MKSTTTRTASEDSVIKENYKVLDDKLLEDMLKRSAEEIAERAEFLELARIAREGRKNPNNKYTNYSLNWDTKVDTPCCLLMPCGKCKELMPCNNYYVLGSRGGSSRRTRLDILGNRRGNICRKCGNEYYIKHSAAKKMLYAAKKRAKEANRDFCLTEEDIVVPKNCPILGAELKEGIGVGARASFSQSPYAPTLDRVDNDLGYVRENIAVISKRANYLKNNGSFKELLAIVAFIADWKINGFNWGKNTKSYYEQGEEACIERLVEYVRKKKELK